MPSTSGDDARFLAAASPLLDAALDVRPTLDSVARIAIPHLADLCIVDLVEAGEIRRVASAAADPALEELLRALPRRYVVGDQDDDAVSRVLATRRSEIVRDGAAAIFGGAEGGLGGRAPACAMLVPLLARDRALGVLVLGRAGSRHAFATEDLALAEDVGGRAALALDNALLFEHQRRVARVLQASLVPEELPAPDGLELGAAFRPAGDGTEIGGDFYDAFTSAGGALCLAIGDVTGKGAGAASMTAMARHTLRTAALYEDDPAAMLGTLNRALLALHGLRGHYCTVALCRLTPTDTDTDGAMDADVVVAGHPLPLVLRRGGDVERAARPGTLLGFTPDPELHRVRTTLWRGDTLVLFTDGLTEARTDEGLLGAGRVESLLGGLAGASAAQVATRLEEAAVDLQDGPPNDDVAVLVARVR